LSANAVLVGAVLTFATTDASQLQLTVTLSSTAAITLHWGELVRSATTSGPHVFGGLPAPRDAPLSYRLQIGAETIAHRVRPMNEEALRIAIYGDSRGGVGPHQRLIQQIADAEPEVVIHTGDVIRWAGDRTGWTEHLASVLPISAEVPVVLALGNHEIFEYWQAPEKPKRDPLVEAMAQIPPPDDPIAKELGAAPSSFHVRIGKTLIVSLDSNADMRPGGAVLRFLDRVLAENQDAEMKLLTMHHGPLSSGHHGGHLHGDDLLAIARARGVHAIVAGHDHLYERIVQDGLTVVISGGGGAPLYPRGHYVPGSAAFNSTYNWVLLAGHELTAYSLEGVELDRDRIPSEHRPRSKYVLEQAALAGLVFLGMFAWVISRVLRGKVR
jgi:3',5'-cyclic AMP phosphodiesterase CpdA